MFVMQKHTSSAVKVHKSHLSDILLKIKVTHVNST